MRYLILVFFIAISSACLAQTPAKGDADVAIDVSTNAMPVDTAMVYTSVEQEPQFGSGITDWNKYLQTNLIYPDKAKQENFEGKVIVYFVVERDGRLTDIKVLRSLSPECAVEAVRLIRNSPKWKPARLSGQNVRCRYTTVVTFAIKN